VLVLFFLITAPSVYGMTEMEIRRELDDIRERLETLLEDVKYFVEEGYVKATFPRIPDDFRFRTHMRFRDYLIDVKYMQIILNASPDTRLIDHGVGSPGNEVNRFGNLTKNALKKFQAKYAEEILYPWGITQPTGIAEIQTLKKLNKILDGEVVIKVMDPERRAEIRKEVLEIAERIRELRRKIDELGDEPEEVVGDGPTNLRAAIVGYGEVRLTWRGDRDAEYFVGYKGTRSGGPYTEVGVTEDTHGMVTGLEYGTRYYFTVTQVIDGRESGYSNEVSLVMDVEPTPFNISAEATDVGELTLEWESDQRNVEKFSVYRAIDPEGPYTLRGTNTRETFRDTGLNLYTIYYYTITQTIDGEESDLSSEYVDSWFYNWRGGPQPHPQKEKILEGLDYTY